MGVSASGRVILTVVAVLVSIAQVEAHPKGAVLPAHTVLVLGRAHRSMELGYPADVMYTGNVDTSLRLTTYQGIAS